MSVPFRAVCCSCGPEAMEVEASGTPVAAAPAAANAGDASGSTPGTEKQQQQQQLQQQQSQEQQQQGCEVSKRVGSHDREEKAARQLSLLHQLVHPGEWAPSCPCCISSCIQVSGHLHVLAASACASR
eukprot:1136338-Pelagomonas_calceolata.AAC.9